MAMIILAILSAWAVSIYSISGLNVQLADNQHKADCARACAESGLEIVRYWLSQVSIPGDTPQNLRFDQIANSFQSTANWISNITPTYDGSSITIPGVTLNSAKAQSFSAHITQIDPETLKLNVTGTYGSVDKVISADFKLGVRADTAFNFGIATKGPLSLAGNILLEGVSVSVESDVYIESQNQPEALSIIGNSQIAGEVTIANPDAYVTLQGGKASIGGETGDAALDHVTIGAAPPEFPTPNPAYFEHYAVNIVDSSTDTTADATFENIKIAAGTNPTFSGHVTLKGIVFIETPNVVTFTGDTTITGIIIGDGSLQDNSATNQINFDGSVESYPVTQLPQEDQFAGLQNETDTFILAPGFHLSFGGNFNTLNGAIAGNGVEFYGNAGGTINGTIINYSSEKMILSGNNDLYFNRSGIDKIPSGFIQDIVLHYDSNSYSEVVL